MENHNQISVRTLCRRDAYFRWSAAPVPKGAGPQHHQIVGTPYFTRIQFNSNQIPRGNTCGGVACF